MEDLSYNLKEFYRNRPPFDQSVPMYHEMPDHLPSLKVELPVVKKPDLGLGFDKVTKSHHEQQRDNNEAYADICKTNKDYEHSMWKHFTEFTFNKQMKDDVLKKFNRVKDYGDYAPLKQPQVPMMFFEKKSLEKLRKLSKKYKAEFCQDG